MLRNASETHISIEKTCEIIKATGSAASRNVFRNVKVSKIYAYRKHYMSYIIFRLFKKRGLTDDEILLKEISKRKVQLFIPKVNRTFGSKRVYRS